MRTLKRIMVLAAIGLAFVITLALTSCKGTGKFYYRGSIKNAVIEITSDKWIETFNGKTTESNIEWISDTIFKKDTYLYYSDGDFFYCIEHPTQWCSKKVIED